MSDDTTPRDEIGAQLFQRARVKAYKKPNADLILFGLFTEAALRRRIDAAIRGLEIPPPQASR